MAVAVVDAWPPRESRRPSSSAAQATRPTPPPPPVWGRAASPAASASYGVAPTPFGASRCPRTWTVRSNVSSCASSPLSRRRRTSPPRSASPPSTGQAAAAAEAEATAGASVGVATAAVAALRRPQRTHRRRARPPPSTPRPTTPPRIPILRHRSTRRRATRAAPQSRPPPPACLQGCRRIRDPAQCRCTCWPTEAAPSAPTRAPIAPIYLRPPPQQAPPAVCRRDCRLAARRVRSVPASFSPRSAAAPCRRLRAAGIPDPRPQFCPSPAPSRAQFSGTAAPRPKQYNFAEFQWRTRAQGPPTRPPAARRMRRAIRPILPTRLCLIRVHRLGCAAASLQSGRQPRAEYTVSQGMTGSNKCIATHTQKNKRNVNSAFAAHRLGPTRQ